MFTISRMSEIRDNFLKNMTDSKLIVQVTTYAKMIDDDATVLLEKEREFLKDPKAFKKGMVEGVKRDGKDKSQRIPKASVKVFIYFSLVKLKHDQTHFQ